MYATAQQSILYINLTFIFQGRAYRSNISPGPLEKLNQDRYTLIEQSGVYSNKAVTYSLIARLIEHVLEFSDVLTLHWFWCAVFKDT